MSLKHKGKKSDGTLSFFFSSLFSCGLLIPKPMLSVYLSVFGVAVAIIFLSLGQNTIFRLKIIS